ncbi:piwi-like protein Siwi isoform X2 [Orussus abietinus]|uniref:piwi-like protein Siwi isoform X2 n=1 Tax=Orussus abietinus TaxID=222816 RepID=UPI000626A5FC|nr:piwi-like protein Siwi isoform X2 [Orussus abietinus]
MSDRPPMKKSMGRGKTQREQQAPPSTSQGAFSRQASSSTTSTRPSTSHHQSMARGTQRPSSRGDSGPGEAKPDPMDTTPIGGGGEAGSLGRGSLRGRRVLPSDLLVTRPRDLKTKKGMSGRPVKLQANYFKLLTTTNWCIFQYRVDFSPEEVRTVVRKGLLKIHSKSIGAYIFDGTVLYCSHRLPQPMELFSKRESDQEKIRITIRLVGDMVRGDHHYLQFFNIIMRKCLGFLNLQLVGRDYYDARNKVEIREYSMELWPGYVTSIRQYEADILMCAEISHKVMRRETILNILDECYRKDGQNYRKIFEEQVIGLVILTDYNNNTYRIDDVDHAVTPTSTFQLRTGDQITYKDYYKNKYNIQIRQDTQPMLVSRSKPRDRRAGQAELIYLVPELCRATGITDEMRNNYRLMAALAQHTRVSPQSRIQKLLSFNQRLNSEPSIVQELKEWNLTLDRKLVDVQGRVLPPEKILFANGRSISAGENADWTKSLRSSPGLINGKLKDWVVIVMSRFRRDAEYFMSNMMKASGDMNISMERPHYCEIPDDRSGTYTQCIEKIMSSSRPQLIFCVVSNNRLDRYSAIKKKCCVDRPVPTQVFLTKTFSNKNPMSIVTKVAVQINCKIGGAPWTVEVPLSGLMVVGFDVCHDTSSKQRDFGAMVASLDKSFCRYFSAVSAHSTGEELSNDLSVNLCKALHVYREYNNALPQRIVIYRDGVGEGQIPYVFEHEVEQLKQKLAGVYGTAPVRMAFILVTKKINTRLFKMPGDNPDPGTVVDDVVTNPVKYDFFVVSQLVRQGTVSPAAYSIISDNVGLDADKLQRLTFKLTHMYYNWSGTVRVPAPCQYAHKLAFLVGQAIHVPPSSHLETLLYFL